LIATAALNGQIQENRAVQAGPAQPACRFDRFLVKFDSRKLLSMIEEPCFYLRFLQLTSTVYAVYWRLSPGNLRSSRQSESGIDESMARPKHEHPTPAELEVLKILWDRGPSSVRDVMEELHKSGRRRAYTSVMSLLNVMADKRLATRKAQGRAFVYTARLEREKTLGGMLHDLYQRAFEGSAHSLVAHLLDESNPSDAELQEIRRTIDEHLQKGGN
jgi:predicted transcriptional regulator